MSLYYEEINSRCVESHRNTKAVMDLQADRLTKRQVNRERHKDRERDIKTERET